MDETLKLTLINYILPKYDEYKSQGFEFWIHDDYLRIKYNHKIYKVKIIFKDNELLWHLVPYNKSYFTTKFKNYDSFELVIFAIKDNDKFYKKN